MAICGRLIFAEFVLGNWPALDKYRELKNQAGSATKLQIIYKSTNIFLKDRSNL